MTKALVLYYSMCDHVETLAGAIADGARGVAGVEVTVKCVPELMAEKIMQTRDVTSMASAELPISYLQLCLPDTSRSGFPAIASCAL